MNTIVAFWLDVRMYTAQREKYFFMKNDKMSNNYINLTAHDTTIQYPFFNAYITCSRIIPVLYNPFRHTWGTLPNPHIHGGSELG